MSYNVIGFYVTSTEVITNIGSWTGCHYKGWRASLEQGLPIDDSFFQSDEKGFISLAGCDAVEICMLVMAGEHADLAGISFNLCSCEAHGGFKVNGLMLPFGCSSAVCKNLACRIPDYVAQAARAGRININNLKRLLLKP